MGIGPYTTGRTRASDSSWMGSRHAVAEAHPGTLRAEAFATAEGVENGVVPSGYPVQEDAEGFYVPFDGTGTLAFSIDDRDITNGDETTAIMWHGRIRVDRLPVDFTPPADAGGFTFDGAADTGTEG